MDGVVLALVLGPAILVIFVRRRRWALAVSGFASLGWVIVGILAQGIGC
jgi:hypothetical protein